MKDGGLRVTGRRPLVVGAATPESRKISAVAGDDRDVGGSIVACLVDCKGDVASHTHSRRRSELKRACMHNAKSNLKDDARRRSVSGRARQRESSPTMHLCLSRLCAR
jgi:hypothetical protein